MHIAYTILRCSLTLICAALQCILPCLRLIIDLIVVDDSWATMLLQQTPIVYLLIKLIDQAARCTVSKAPSNESTLLVDQPTSNRSETVVRILNADVLCLGLGLLTNLLEAAEDGGRSLIAETSTQTGWT